MPPAPVRLPCGTAVGSAATGAVGAAGCSGTICTLPEGAAGATGAATGSEVGKGGAAATATFLAASFVCTSASDPSRCLTQPTPLEAPLKVICSHSPSLLLPLTGADWPLFSWPILS